MSSGDLSYFLLNKGTLLSEDKASPVDVDVLTTAIFDTFTLSELILEFLVDLFLNALS